MESCEDSNDVLSAPVPEHWNKSPTVEIVDTEYAFDMHVDPDENNKWLFNAELNKLFIKLKNIMKVKVSYKPVDDSEKVFLRAMILFASSDDILQEVKRCINHRYEGDNKVMPQEHILRCYHPDTQYMGNENGKLFGERLSVLVPLGGPVIDEDGKASQSIMFDFVCQNSCASGICRKPTLIVFTLENEGREIIGKKVLPFTVCSNPKREVARENSFNLGKRKSNFVLDGKRPSKMVCLPEMKIDGPEPHTFTITLPDTESLRNVITCALNFVNAMEGTGNTENERNEMKKKYLDYFKYILNSLDDSFGKLHNKSSL